MNPLKINLKDYNVKLHLVRHGQDEQDKMGGWSDNHLTTLGIKQIQDLIPQIDDHYDLFVASDLVRTKETAEILNCKLNMNINYDPGFRETNNGCYKNMSKAEFNEHHYKRFTELEENESFGGGDTPNTFYNRVKDSFITLLENNKNKKILLVTHGGVISVILCLVKGVEYSNHVKMHPGTGGFIKL